MATEPETKTFRTLILGSLTCGIMICHGSVSDIHEAVSHLCGHPVWTHEITLYADAAKAEALRQFPDLPDAVPDDWEACAAQLLERYGEALEAQRGTGERTASPLDTIHQVMPHAEVIVVETGGTNA